MLANESVRAPGALLDRIATGEVSGWYKLTKGDSGRFSFVLKAVNHETILRSEQYESRGSAENGIASVQKNGTDDGRFERKASSDGRFFFNLKAGNHQVIAASRMYETVASRGQAIESVKDDGLERDHQGRYLNTHVCRGTHAA